MKNSASCMGMPSSTFFSEATEGLTRPCSISEIMPFVTPARLASSRCESPCIRRTAFSRALTSLAIAHALHVYDIKQNLRNIAPACD